MPSVAYVAMVGVEDLFSALSPALIRKQILLQKVAVDKVESKLESTCLLVWELSGEYLDPESNVFYLKVKGDHFWYNLLTLQMVIIKNK